MCFLTERIEFHNMQASFLESAWQRAGVWRLDWNERISARPTHRSLHLCVSRSWCPSSGFQRRWNVQDLHSGKFILRSGYSSSQGFGYTNLLPLRRFGCCRTLEGQLSSQNQPRRHQRNSWELSIPC
jgi:hypothetical protein